MSRTKGMLATVGIAAVAASLLPFTAGASEGAVQADVDGDGRPDPVSLRQVSDDTMLLRVGLRDQFVDADIAGNARGQSPRAVDVNGDGVDEVMVPESVGANTITYTVWRYDAGLRPVRRADGDLWRLAEGGGVSAVSAYECSLPDAARQLTTISATQRPAGNGYVYQGTRETYSVRDGVAVRVAETPVQATERDDPALRGDPGTCAPLR